MPFIISVTVSVAIPGDQCLGGIMVTVDGKQRNILSGEPLPLSPKSTLTWMGSAITYFYYTGLTYSVSGQEKLIIWFTGPHTSIFGTAQDQDGIMSSLCVGR